MYQFNDRGCDSFDNYLLDFLAVPYTDKNGNAIDRLKDESYVAWLKTYNRLARKGLLKDDIFVDSRAANVRENTKWSVFLYDLSIHLT